MRYICNPFPEMISTDIQGNFRKIVLFHTESDNQIV